MDNYATHKTPLIRNWLAKRPRWHMHLTPPSSSWLNQVERFFALIAERKIRRRIHRSVTALRPRLHPSSNITMPIPSRSDGQNQPTIFSAQSNASVLQFANERLTCHEFLVRNTSRERSSVTVLKAVRLDPPLKGGSRTLWKIKTGQVPKTPRPSRREIV
jgi:hypothetical protein